MHDIYYLSENADHEEEYATKLICYGVYHGCFNIFVSS